MFENLQKYKINFFLISKKTELGQPKKWARTTNKNGPGQHIRVRAQKSKKNYPKTNV